MATSRISNTIKAPDGTAIASVPVTVMLMPSAGFRQSDFTEVARIASTTTNASGFWQLDLERNANITPDNSWYEVVEQVPAASGGRRVWNIAVGDSDQTLLASLVTPAEQQPTVVPAGTVYLDQAAADARYQALAAIGATPNTIEPDDAASAGVSASAARADHEHGIVAAAPSNVGLAGTNSEGAATSFARSNHIHAHNPPATRIRRTTNQSIAASTETIISFDAERYDTDNMWVVGTPTRITMNTAGLYDIKATVAFSAGGGSWTSYMFFRVNGTTRIAQTQTLAPDTLGTTLTLATTWKFAATDYVEVGVWQNSGTEDVLSTASYSPEFSATWIGVG